MATNKEKYNLRMSSEWNVIFRTGHREFTGVRGNVFLQVTDSHFKKTPIVKFGNAQPNLFDPCSKDKFSFLLPVEFEVFVKLEELKITLFKKDSAQSSSVARWQ